MRRVPLILFCAASAFLISCPEKPYPGTPLEAARRISPQEAPGLLLDPRLTSIQRARAAAVLAGRFGAKAVPWIRRALERYPREEWPDRSLAVRALRAAGKDPGAKKLLLDCLADKSDPGIRREAALALEAFLPDTEVRLALQRTSRTDPSPLVRRAAGKALGK